MSGRLIVIDGLDGSGKQTQTQLLYERLQKEGVAVRKVSFPDYEQPSSALVKEYLAGRYGKANDVCAYAASSFYAVDRYASYQCFWKADYLSGHTILADRYTTSNLVHQLSKLPSGQWKEFIDWLEDYEYHKLGLPRPDLVLYLDVEPEVSRKLLERRYDGDEKKKDIHEADLKYQMRCRDCALTLAGQQGWCLVQCSSGQRMRGIEEIAEEIYRVVRLEK